MHLSRILLGLICYLRAPTPAEARVEAAPPGFLDLGTMVAGLSYGHLHTFLNVSHMVEALEERLSFAEKLTNKTLASLRITKDKRLAAIQTQWHHRFETRADGYLRRIREISRKFELGNSREKRQALLGAVTGIAGLGLSLYNGYRITELEERVSKQEDNLLHFVEAAQGIFGRIKKNEALLDRKIDQLNDEARQLHREFTVTYLQQRMDLDLDRVGHGVDRAEDTAAAILQGRMPPFLFDSEVLRREVIKFSQSLGGKNMEIVHDILKDGYKFEASFVPTKDGVRIYVHVPITSGGPLKVYKMLQAPFFGAQGLLFTVRTPKNILVVNDEHTKAVAISPGDLALCRRSQNMHYCDGLRTFLKKPEETCVGAVFSGSHQHMKTHCEIGVDRLGEALVMVNETSFMVLSTQSKVQLQQTCEKTGTTVKSGEILSIKPGCTAFTENFWFSAGGDVESPAEVVHSPLLVEEGFLELGELSIADIRKHADQHIQDLDLTSLDQIKKAILHDRGHSDHRNLTYALVAIGVVLAVAVAALAAWFYRERARAQKAREDRRRRREERFEMQDPLVSSSC